MSHYGSGDVLSAEVITGYLESAETFRVEVRKTVTSTNTVLREMAAKSCSGDVPEGLVLAAEEQSAGKGRLGRSFYSPGGHGVYFSLLLRPRLKACDAALITPAAAVAAALAIEAVTGARAGIKWVNDLFLNGKKVCGILTEATFSMGGGIVESAVLGVGINTTRPENGYPEGLDGAAALADRIAGKNNERSRLIAATLNKFWRYYKDLPARGFLDEYRARSVVLGQDIYVLSDGGKKRARALAIDDDCRLVVRYDNGGAAVLDSGEVSIAIDN